MLSLKGKGEFKIIVPYSSLLGMRYFRLGAIEVLNITLCP